MNSREEALRNIIGIADKAITAQHKAEDESRQNRGQYFWPSRAGAFEGALLAVKIAADVELSFEEQNDEAAGLRIDLEDANETIKQLLEQLAGYKYEAGVA